MISRIAVRIRQLQRLFSRSYWAIRLFNLPRIESTATTPGLVLIQIDGLAFNQYLRGVREKNLPFLNSLKVKQQYKEYLHYSGLPSNTPAVQGELFYGVKGCVPAFSFMDKETGKPFVMLEYDSARIIEQRISTGNTPLLQGGSSYSNIFEGGAAEAHYCAASGGLTRLFKIFNPLRWICVIFFHPNIFIRTLVLGMLEVFLAVYDCLRGILAGKKVALEARFILARVIVCVLVRELIVMEAQIDIARGLSVIHLNFFGYDEQAHQRGPSSKFAHWSLRGIDDCARRIWKAARLAERRDYDIWIYSDHGQQDAIPYLGEHGESIDEVILKIFGEEKNPAASKMRGHARVNTCCGGGLLKNNKHSKALFDENSKVKIMGMGPIGHIYTAEKLSSQEQERVVSEMILTAKIPVVFSAKQPGIVEARTLKGKFILPEQAHEILGSDHPFLNEAAKDLVALCHHPSAGDIVFSGWHHGIETVSFPSENGSHAGYGPEETRGFALLPSDVRLSVNNPVSLRPLDIREAALRHLGKLMQEEFPCVASCEKSLRLLTYNVHGCVGLDGILYPERIARVIARHDVDVVALQELDVGRNRSGMIHQAEKIAQQLKMNFHFHPSLRLAEGEYGNAILSRFPMKVIRMDALPRLKINTLYEPRGAIWAQIDMNGKKVNLITTHLSLWPAERAIQIKDLLGSGWLGHADCDGATLLCGDFNANPRSTVYKNICSQLRDAQVVLDSHKPQSSHSLGRIDHVFLSPKWDVLKILVSKTELDRVASDHFPMIVELKLE